MFSILLQSCILMGGWVGLLLDLSVSWSKWCFWGPYGNQKRAVLLFKGPHSPKMHCASRSATLNFVWHETSNTFKICYHRLFFITIWSCTYILIRLCKYIPCSTFYSSPVLICTYSVSIYKIGRYKLTSTRRDGGHFELLECIQPIRLCVWTIERFKTKTNDRNESWMKVGL